MDFYNSMIIGEGTSSGDAISLMWLGTAGVLISDGKSGILIDPYVSRFSMFRIIFRMRLDPVRALVQKWTERMGKGKIQAVIVSHSHFDHSLDAPFFAMESGAPLIGSESTLNIGRGAGLQEKQLKLVRPGQTITVGRFTVQFIESRHGPLFFGKVPYPGTIDKPVVPPAQANDYKVGTIFGILIKHRSGTILHHGSAGFIPGMYTGIKADLVLLGIAGRGDTAAYIKEVPAMVRPAMVIPIHLDNFFVPLDEGITFLPTVGFNEFCDSAGRYKSDFMVRTIPIGKPVQVLPRVR